MRLPGIDGLELCRRLTASGPTARVAVLMMSERARESDRAAAARAGAAGLLEKPFPMRDLLARVRALVSEPEFGVEACSVTRSTSSKADAT
jgi:DNA-binding response OmpR family regulator